jgi:succinoglycan biosynthesis transport protein ExoP
MEELPDREMRLAELALDLRAAQDTYALLRAKLDEAKIKERESINASAVKIIEPSYVFPVDPKSQLKIFLALLLSPLLGVGLAFFLNYLDNTVKTPREAEELLGLPVFSVVPFGKNHNLVRRPESPALCAAYQMISTQLWQAVRDTNRSTVVVTSAEPDSGRTTTAANLAVSLANDGAKVILVDSDMRKPSLHLMFGAENRRGFSNLLTGTAAIEDVAIPTKFEGLLLIPSGPMPDNPIRLLRQQQMQTFVDQINSLADFVIFDSPSGVTFADASLIAAYVNNVIIVHAAGRVPRGAENEFRDKLEQVEANVIGAVLIRVRPEDSHGYFHYRKSYQEVLPPARRGVKSSINSDSHSSTN